jgi:preprotein translocase subunit YajC
VFDFLIILLFGLAIMWMLVVLPQRRRQQAHDRLVSGLQPGDYVVTAGGVYGTVTEVGHDDVGLEIAPDVEIRVAKRAIGTVVPPDQIEEIEVEEEPAERATEEQRG